jgi:hypothetical protein
MELPIQVIVVLFIALVVGGAIIAFSQDAFNRAQIDINDWRADPQKRDMVVEVNEATDQTIEGLANSCVRENIGNIDEKVCFALFASAFTVDWGSLHGMTLENNFTLDTTAVDPGANAVRITYHPLKKVIVS